MIPKNYLKCEREMLESLEGDKNCKTDLKIKVMYNYREKFKVAKMMQRQHLSFETVVNIH